MMNAFTFPFDDLSLVQDGLIEGGLLAGQAEISFDEEGDWFVSTLSLDGYGPGNQCQQVAVERSSPLFNLIVAQLDAPRWSDLIKDQIGNELDEICNRSWTSRGHSTLNHRQQGLVR